MGDPYAGKVLVAKGPKGSDMGLPAVIYRVFRIPKGYPWTAHDGCRRQEERSNQPALSLMLSYMTWYYMKRSCWMSFTVQASLLSPNLLYSTNASVQLFTGWPGKICSETGLNLCLRLRCLGDTLSQCWQVCPPGKWLKDSSKDTTSTFGSFRPAATSPIPSPSTESSLTSLLSR